MIYTIGIQRWPLPFFRKYKVTYHKVETLDGSIRAALYLSDGSVVVVPRLDRKALKIYPDYRIAHQQMTAMSTSESPPMVVSGGPEYQ